MKSVGTVRVTSIAGDTASPVNGDLWYNSSTNKFRKRENGASSDLSGSSSGITRSILSISSVTTGAAVASTDYVYLCSGTFTFTMPTAVANTNLYTLKNSGSGTVTIVFTSGQNADGSISIVINPYTSIGLISDNSNWWVI